MKKYIYLSFCFLFLLGFISCTDEEDPIVVEENTPPVADAGTDLAGNTGSTVTLDGSASSDVDEDPLTYSWAITTRPEGSTATLTNADAAIATFIPDVGGSYTVQLTVSDGEATDTDEAIVTVEGEPMETVEVSSHINEETVWEDIFSDPAVPDYYVTRDIDVNAKLTIEPGVVVHLAENAVMTVESGGGTLVAEGLADNKITFTSFDEEGEILWGGILLNSSSSLNTLEHVNMAYAGGEEFLYANGWRAASVGVANDGRLGLNNVTITKSGVDGVFVHQGGTLSAFSDNTFSQNGGFPLSLSINQLGLIDASNAFADDEATDKKENTVRVYDSQLNEDQEWSALANGARYLFQGNVSVEANLTISEGAILEFDQDVQFAVTENGVLIAQGTEGNPVVFTSSSVADGIKWAGLYVHSSSINNELDFVQVSHAGSDEEFYAGGWRATTIGIGNGAKLKLTNSEISHSADYGLFLHADGAFEAFANNHFHDNAGYPLYLKANMAGMMDEATVIENNAHDVVAVYQSSFTDDAAFNDPATPELLALNGDAKYLFTGNLTVHDDLKIAEGAYLAFGGNVLVNVETGGSLNAVGTAENKIVLTAYERDGNHNWNGIYFQSANTNNHIEHAEVSYGGFDNEMYISGWVKANLGVDSGASLEINHTDVTNSKGYGIIVHSAGDLTGTSGLSYSNNAQGDLLQK